MATITTVQNKENMQPNLLTSPPLVESPKDNVKKGSKLSKKQLLVDAIFQPDKKGFSEWVSKVDQLEGTDLDWGKNGAQRHGIFFGDNRFNWEKRTEKRSITHLRTVGYSETYLHGASRPIRDDIHKYHKSMPCVVCGSRSDLVTDHKNDLYNDPRVLCAATQTRDDFQCLCNHCNLQKRQVSKKTKETNQRCPATDIPQFAIFGVDFTQGDKTFDPTDINAMVGTYWYDPVSFLKHIKESM